jgi:hypothetical protein
VISRKDFPLPDKATADALHTPVATVIRMDFLVTWNCTHIANAVVLKIVNTYAANGNEPPLVYTPEELMTP